VKLPSLNPYYLASLALVTAAVILVAIAVLVDRRDLTSAALVLSSVVCLITGIFLATLSGGEPLNNRYMSLFSVQGCINLCTVCADLGISGNACMLPAGKDGRTHSLQFIPVASYEGAPAGGASFATGPDTAGLLTVPSGMPLYHEIRTHEHLVIPSEIPQLMDLIKEVGVDVLEVADQVSAEADGSVITVTMQGYRLIGGCMAVAAESPKCCTTNPCPVCSLFACLLAEGTGTVVQLERCTPNPEDRSVTAVVTLLP